MHSGASMKYSSVRKREREREYKIQNYRRELKRERERERGERGERQRGIERKR